MYARALPFIFSCSEVVDPLKGAASHILLFFMVVDIRVGAKVLLILLSLI